MMAAKMEAQGHDVLFNEAAEGGHGPGATHAEEAEYWALSYTFFKQKLDWAVAVRLPPAQRATARPIERSERMTRFRCCHGYEAFAGCDWASGNEP